MKMTLKKNILFICSLTLAIGSTAYGDIYSEAVKNIKMEELANTYSCKKINEVLKDYKNSKDKYKAVLVDMGAISVDDLNKNKNIEEKINLFVSDYIDTTENYIGNVSDKNIIERVQNKWNNSKVIKDSKLIGYLNNAVVKGLTTGYNLKNKNDYANFNNFQSLTLSYGHNDIVHASQIIALMKSENIDAKVQLEPKTSAFIYLKEWGEPSYVCSKMDDGTIIAHPLEYDLKFEFSTAKDKQRFCDMIEKYAKKDSEDEEGLLFESWWQPFMQEIRMETVDGDTKKSSHENKTSGFMLLHDNVAYIEGENYEAHILTLPKDSRALVDELTKKDKSFEIKVTTKEVWVNPSFYRFMNGEYK